MAINLVKLKQMKKIATCFLLLLFCLLANAQIPDYEPESSIEIEVIVDMDSLLLFEFTDTAKVAHEISSTFGAHWRNGDFICIYSEELWDCENFYLITGSVKFRRLTKQQQK